MSNKKETMREIPAELYERLDRLGMLPNDVRDHNQGESDYSQHLIQPWAIWQEYGLNPFDADIIKRVLRHKATDPRRLDYEKIIHICQERIRQIDHEPRGRRISGLKRIFLAIWHQVTCPHDSSD